MLWVVSIEERWFARIAANGGVCLILRTFNLDIPLILAAFNVEFATGKVGKKPLNTRYFRME